jgi:hypothetical protein
MICRGRRVERKTFAERKGRTATGTTGTPALEVIPALSLVPNRERRGGREARVVGGASAPRRFRLGD